MLVGTADGTPAAGRRVCACKGSGLVCSASGLSAQPRVLTRRARLGNRLGSAPLTRPFRGLFSISEIVLDSELISPYTPPIPIHSTRGAFRRRSQGGERER